MNPSHNTSLARILRCSHPTLLLILAGSLLLGAPCAAQTCDYTVSSLADSGDGTLRTGLADANAPNICFRLKGTITLSSTLQVTRPVTITATGVTISGGGKVEILVINTPSPTDVVRINGLTLTGGNASEGGAAWVEQGDVTFVGTTIDKNSAALAGGIYNSGTLSLSQCAVTNNTSVDYSGGGIYNGATLSLTGTTVSGNSAGTQNGGGLDNLGTAQISGGTFSSNRASRGGAISNEQGGQLLIQQGTTFSNNSAVSDAGGIYNSSGGQLQIQQGSTFSNNSAAANSGAIYNAGATTITGALFNGNQAGTPGVASRGGALFTQGITTITESTFTANSIIGSGGAIETDYYATTTLDDDTISGNTASASGSGLNNLSYIATTINNTIIAGNTAIGDVNADCSGCANAKGSANLIGVTVNLGPLANNSGPTQTMMPLPGSSAISAGAATATADITDQRGFSRLNAKGGLDVGAVQTHYTSVGFVAQPSNTLVNQSIPPPVAVQVVETDGSTTNYPLGVPVTLSLINGQSNPTTGTLTGTLTEYPTSQGGVNEAVFADLSVDTPGSYQLFATDAISGNSSSGDASYNATSNVFQISLPPVVTLNWQPAPLTYGPLPRSELNALATINGAPATGTFVYTFIATGATVNVGQIYPVGVYPAQVVFTPTGSTTQYTAGTSLQISQATPVLTWPTPSPIYTSTPLSATQLDATATGVTGAALAGTFVYTPAAGTTLTAGSHVLSATFTPTDATAYASTNVQVTIQVHAVTAATVTIQDSANPITFGQVETFTATVTGTDGQPFSGGTTSFTVDGAGIGSAPVTNGSGSVSDASLTAGTHAVGVSYTNAGTNQTLTAATTLAVNKATPKLTWPTPAAIFISTRLSATQLDATATGVTGAALAGTFAYSPAAGATLPAGSQSLSATFTPSDTTDYITNTAQVAIQVNAPTAATVVIQESAKPITFGQSETFTAVVTGTDGKPLSGGTAAFTVDGAGIGSPLVTNGSASVNDTSLTAGTHNIGVSYTNTATSQTLTAATTLTVNKATPKLTWPTPAAIYASTPLSATQLDASAAGVTGSTLAGAFAYNPTAGTTLTAGSHVLSTTFTPTDSTDYTANTAQVTVQVNAPTAATVVIQESAKPITFGQSETFTAVVTGTDGKPLSGGTAAFTVDGAGIGSPLVTNGSASVNDTSLTAGTHNIGVSYTNTATSQTLTAATTLTVNKATPKLTWPTPAAIYASTPLSATQLDASAAGVTGSTLAGAFAYNPTAGTTLTAGSHVLSTTFTPTDSTDYTANTAQVTVQVNAPTAATVVIQESAKPITFGQSETFTAVVTGTDGKPLSGGTAAFTVDGAGIGSPLVTNGSASVNDTSLTAGTHNIGVSYTNTATSQTLTAATTLTVNKATPKLTWPTPAAIYASTPLSATQLDASAAGVTGSTLAGAFAYNPTAGTTLTAGSHVLSTTFTPTDSTDYTANTAQVTVQVNAPTAATVVIQESAKPITFGQSETFTATVSGSDGLPFSGGTAAFTSDGTAIGSATVVNGSASVTASSLTAGAHQIAISYTNSALAQPLAGSATLTVNKAAPVIAWSTSAPIYTVTPLSSTQLNAAATGVNRASLPGTFIYSPAVGATLPAGAQTLSTTFTPTDTADYTNAMAHITIQVGHATIAITSVSPGTASVSASPLSITVTGSGFTPASELEVNGTPIATTVQSSTAITAAIPGTDLAKAGTLNISVYDPASKFSSNVVQLPVTAPTANVTFSIPETTDSGEQPAINIDSNSPYPADLQGTLTLTFAPAGNNGVDDPAIQFSTGGRTLSFTVPAGSTTAPQVALQTGTVAGTITVTLTLTAGGVDVTPPGLAPITLVIAPGVPVITSVTFSNNSQGQVTVVISGFSNTRDMNQAEFIFTGTGASSLREGKVDVSVPGMFSTWYGSSDSDQYGSEFTYTQNFQLSKPDQGITGVAVTLANSVGTSGSVNSQ